MLNYVRNKTFTFRHVPFYMYACKSRQAAFSKVYGISFALDQLLTAHPVLGVWWYEGP